MSLLLFRNLNLPGASLSFPALSQFAHSRKITAVSTLPQFLFSGHCWNQVLSLKGRVSVSIGVKSFAVKMIFLLFWMVLISDQDGLIRISLKLCSLIINNQLSCWSIGTEVFGFFLLDLFSMTHQTVRCCERKNAFVKNYALHICPFL